jgi:hypothetical protein
MLGVVVALALFATCNAAAATHSSSAASSEGPDLFEITPANFQQVCDGGLLVIAALVNPVSPRCEELHPKLHQLNAAYHGRDDVLIAYFDVMKHREFVKRFALREVPTILAFPRGLPAMSPSVVEYGVNRSVSDYKRDINHLIALTNGLESESDKVLDVISALAAVLAKRDEALLNASIEDARQKQREQEEGRARREGQREGAASFSEPQAAAPVETAGLTEASVDADGNIAVSNASASLNVSKPLRHVDAVVEEYRNLTDAPLCAVETELNATIADLTTRVEKLRFARDMLRNVTARDSGQLAKVLNDRRRGALASQKLLGEDEKEGIMRDVGVLEDLITLIQG